MRLKRFCTMLAITAGIIAASGAIATTWDATADFSQSSATGVWSYGTCFVSNINWTSTYLDVNSYAFSADTWSGNALSIYGNVTGFQWAKSDTGNTEWGNNGEPLAWTGLVTSSVGGWTMSEPGLYVQPYAIDSGGAYGVTGYATVLRWTAQTAGTYNLQSSIKNMNGNAGATDILVKTAADGTRSVVHSIAGASLAAGGTDSFTGSVDLGANDTLDLVVYQSPVYLRNYDKVGFTITSQDVPEPGSLLALGASLMSLGGLALRRRK